MVSNAHVWMSLAVAMVATPPVCLAQVASPPPRSTPAPGGQAPPAAPAPGGQATPAQPQRSAGATTAATGLPLPTDYVIGPDDVLGIIFWRDAEMSGDVTVRPDGNITLPLIRDIKAAGLRPDELRAAITAAATQYVADPNVSVVVRQINSRSVFITGQVARPGAYPVSGQMTVLQLVAIAGGLTEYADGGQISLLRTVNGKPTRLRFNYDEVARGKKLEQNVVLAPGDQVVVP
jgi:polysaccharide biosynthesis/export protein